MSEVARVVRDGGVVDLAARVGRRFRENDGYSHSRALALQVVLAVIPFLVALTGLASALHEGSFATVVANSISTVTPGGRSSDALAAAIGHSRSTGTSSGGVLVLVGGLLVAFGAATVGVGQMERGTNRLRHEDDDRPFLAKYRRAALLAAVAAPGTGLSFLLLVAGGPFIGSASSEYGWGDGVRISCEVLRWPVGLALLVGVLVLVLERAPVHRPTGRLPVCAGALTTLVMVGVVTGALTAYLHVSGSISETYGPLASVMALLVWALWVSSSFFYGAAVCAELEVLPRS